MKRTVRMIALLMCLTIMPGLLVCTASADAMYLIPDSGTRKLTAEEIWKWDRESIPYLWNEILARHGYVFKAGGQYDLWFRSLPWYTPNENPDNEKYCNPQLTKLEWDNIKLLKQVAKEMDEKKETRHTKGRNCYRDFTPPGDWTLTGFTVLPDLKAGQSVPVYSAPSESSWRGANGKACVSTDGAVWCAGWENGWLLVFYETNHGSVRVGYAQGLEGKINITRQLNFEYMETVTTAPCNLTDDPVRAASVIRNIPKDTTVLYLTTVINQNGEAWDYIQTEVSGRQARGFIPEGILGQYYEEETAPEKY